MQIRERQRRHGARAFYPELRDWLRRTSTSQYDFAVMLGISPASVSRLLNAERGMSIAMAMRVALATGIPVEKLLLDPKTRQLVRLVSDQRRAAIVAR